MKIKKHGKLFKGSTEKDKYEQFKCENCGCEFSVKEDEYYKDSWADILPKITISATYSWSPTNNTLICSCPECYKICKKYVNKYTNTYTVCNCDDNIASSLKGYSVSGRCASTKASISNMDNEVN